MDAALWKRVKTVLEGALELAGARRREFLDEKCGDDHALRAEVDALLASATESADRALEENAFAAVLPETNGSRPDKLIGGRVGRFTITEKIGSGGMGAVYAATRSDGAFVQKAAVKLIKSGISSATVLRRFLNERQILASLQHANIAHLIDGGETEDGLPFFVMEYVEGVAITDYANEKKLGLHDRLDLFREVCAGVAFAHQSLVIHRDLKPSNIIVTETGEPKLLDFGIAKLITAENNGDTATHHLAMTPDYASPEQLRGEPLTTATDVYSLGVILYELLTGRRPFKFENKNIGQVITAATQNRPPKPSSAPKSEAPGLLGMEQPRALRGDLDNIVLKALNKEPRRRYSSVEQFSEDIRRHLKGLPVTARADTLRYRAEKFTRRNPLVIGAIALAFVILLVGIAGVAWQARVANVERAKAERRFNDVRSLANSFIFEVNEKIAESPLRARELLVERSLEYLDRLAVEAAGDADLQAELAAAYEKIGNVQAEIFNPSAGKSSQALISHQKALEIRKQLFAATPTRVDRGIEVSNSLANIGDILSATGRVTEAADKYREAIALTESLPQPNESYAPLRRTIASHQARLGQAILRSASLGDALNNYEKALALYLALRSDNQADTTLERSISIMYSYIGYVRMEMAQHDEAVRNFTDSLSLTQKLQAGDSGNQQLVGALSTAHLWLGVALAERGDFKQSVGEIRKALEIQTRLFETDKGNFGEQNSLADCYLQLGRVLAKQADSTTSSQPLSQRSAYLNDSVKALETARQNYSAVWSKDADNLFARRQIALAGRHLARTRQKKGETEKALETFREALAEFQELTRLDANNSEWQHDLALCHVGIGEILLDGGKNVEAKSNFATAIPILERLVEQSPDYVSRQQDLVMVRDYLARLSND